MEDSGDKVYDFTDYTDQEIREHLEHLGSIRQVDKDLAEGKLSLADDVEDPIPSKDSKVQTKGRRSKVSLKTPAKRKASESESSDSKCESSSDSETECSLTLNLNLNQNQIWKLKL